MTSLIRILHNTRMVFVKDDRYCTGFYNRRQQLQRLDNGNDFSVHAFNGMSSHERDVHFISGTIDNGTDAHGIYCVNP